MIDRELKQKDVAASLGISHIQFGKWMQGKAKPSLANIHNLAKYFKINPKEFMK